jgi:hypothetical protein
MSWAAQKFTVALKANDPTCYDPTAAGFIFTASAGYEVPYEIPLAFDGPVVIDQLQTIVYAGDWLSYPVIRITGPIINPCVTNESTGETLDFTGYTIAAGNYYDIDCRYGHKTVLDGNNVNRIAELTSASDLATFHLAPAREVAGGINSIRLEGTSQTADSNIQFSYLAYYLGV